MTDMLEKLRCLFPAFSRDGASGESKFKAPAIGKKS